MFQDNTKYEFNRRTLNHIIEVIVKNDLQNIYIPLFEKGEKVGEMRYFEFELLVKLEGENEEIEILKQEKMSSLRCFFCLCDYIYANAFAA